MRLHRIVPIALILAAVPAAPSIAAGDAPPCAAGTHATPVASAPPMVAIRVRTCRADGAGSVDRIEVWDVRTGRRKLSSLATVAKGPGRQPARWVRLGSVVVTASGAVAWTASGASDPDQVVAARPGRAPRVLETGPQVGTLSLAGAPDGTVYWRSRGDAIRTARLD